MNNQVQPAGIRDTQFRPFRKSKKKFPVNFLAAMAVLLNLLVPLTHGVLAEAGASELVEICTSNGIELVALNGARAGSADAGNTDQLCEACPDCTLCQFGAAKPLFFAKVDTRTGLLSASLTIRARASEISLFDDPAWIRPGNRAPPAV